MSFIWAWSERGLVVCFLLKYRTVLFKFHNLLSPLETSTLRSQRINKMKTCGFKNIRNERGSQRKRIKRDFFTKKSRLQTFMPCRFVSDLENNRKLDIVLHQVYGRYFVYWRFSLRIFLHIGYLFSIFIILPSDWLVLTLQTLV